MSITLPATEPARHSALTEADGIECPSCEASMTITPNPYYGTGLAQHRTIALCTGCHNIAFVPEAPVTEAGAAERLVGRMRSLFGRR
jgi:hypothetical protein